MFKFQIKSDSCTSFCLSDKSYSIARVNKKNELSLHKRLEFTNATKASLEKSLAQDIEQFNLIGHPGRLILTPGQYQLLLMDAANVPESELAKALKWRLKGLVDYHLNDLALDAFLVPPHGPASQRKKAFVAATSLTELNAKLKIFESAFIDISEVGIAELSLRNIGTMIPGQIHAPIIIIALDDGGCQLHIFYKNQLYLVRSLPLTLTVANGNTPQAQNILLEIQRSVDYCLSELKIPEPREIIFTPSFCKSTALLNYFREESGKDIRLLDLNDFFKLESEFSLEQQQAVLYAVGGAMSPNIDEQNTDELGEITMRNL